MERYSRTRLGIVGSFGEGTLNPAQNDSADMDVLVLVTIVVSTAVLQCFIHTPTPLGEFAPEPRCLI
jgi:hypothetical protein